jgi:glycerophosphoryl diester phosphodiesterase
MLSDRKQVRIISLGEIVVIDIIKTIQAFTGLIAKKKQAANPVEIGKVMGLFLQQNMKSINDFKLGSLNEIDFTQQMIDSLKKATDVELTVSEFDQAWNAMNPKLEQFEPLLKQTIEYNNLPKQQVIFISFTNPKDIKHLKSELEKSNIGYKIDNDQLVELGGIQLYTTYSSKKTKAELIETTIKKLNTKSSTKSSLANSMSNVLSLEQVKETELEIKYIRSVNSINDPILKDDLDKTNHEVEIKAAGFFVDTILWMKNEKTLSDVLRDPQKASNQISVAKL